MRKLWLDDTRKAPDTSWDRALDYDQFVSYIEANGVPDLISFDHDLGRGAAERRGGWIPRVEFQTLKTGLDCVKYLIEHELPIKEYEVHSANPIGRENLLCLLGNWKKHCEEQHANRR